MKVGYARVSTHEQNLDSQIDSLNDYSCDKVIFEKVTSRKEDRKKLKEVLGWLREEDTLVCTKMDRLARSMKELSAIMDNLSKRNVNVVFLDQNIDTTQAGGKLIFHILAAFAEFERDLIRERTLAGLKSARARGKKGGRRKILKGTKLATAFKMYDSNTYTVKQICESLSIKERTFYEYLKRRQETTDKMQLENAA